MSPTPGLADSRESRRRCPISAYLGCPDLGRGRSLGSQASRSCWAGHRFWSRTADVEGLSGCLERGLPGLLVGQVTIDSDAEPNRALMAQRTPTALTIIPVRRLIGLLGLVGGIALTQADAARSIEVERLDSEAIPHAVDRSGDDRSGHDRSGIGVAAGAGSAGRATIRVEAASRSPEEKRGELRKVRRPQQFALFEVGLPMEFRARLGGLYTYAPFLVDVLAYDRLNRLGPAVHTGHFFESRLSIGRAFKPGIELEVAWSSQSLVSMSSGPSFDRQTVGAFIRIRH